MATSIGAPCSAGPSRPLPGGRAGGRNRRQGPAAAKSACADRARSRPNPRRAPEGGDLAAVRPAGAVSTADPPAGLPARFDTHYCAPLRLDHPPVERDDVVGAVDPVEELVGVVRAARLPRL